MNSPDNKGFSRERLRNRMESVATFGLILVAVGLVAPFASFENTVWNVVFKYVFSSGALIYTAARIVGSLGKDESFRVRSCAASSRGPASPYAWLPFSGSTIRRACTPTR